MFLDGGVMGRSRATRADRAASAGNVGARRPLRRPVGAGGRPCALTAWRAPASPSPGSRRRLRRRRSGPLMPQPPSQREAARRRAQARGSGIDVTSTTKSVARDDRRAMTETEFIAAADAHARRHRRGARRALATSDADVDWSLNDGILEIECADGSKLIVNRHVPNREIWVAARSGGFHFRPTTVAGATRAAARSWRRARRGSCK